MNETLAATGQKKERLPEILYTGCVLTLLVMLIHILSEYITSGTHGVLHSAVSCLWRLFGFATYGFVFLAGLRFSLSQKARAGDFSAGHYLLSRLRRLLPLYLLWSVLYYFWGLFTAGGGFSWDRIRDFRIAELLFGFLTGNTASHLYFVPVLLQFALLAPLSRLLRRRLPASVILPVSLLLTFCFGTHLTDYTNALFPSLPEFAYSDRIFTSFLFFWSAGCCAGEEYDRFCALLDRNRALLTGVFLFSAVLNLYSVYAFFVLGRGIWCLPQVTVLYTISAVLFLLMLCRLLAARKPPSSFCNAFDRAGYTLYLSHLLPILVVSLCTNAFGISPLAALPIRLAAVFLWAAAVTFLRMRLSHRTATAPESEPEQHPKTNL